LIRILLPVQSAEPGYEETRGATAMRVMHPLVF
jgi:hypothetical protein